MDARVTKQRLGNMLSYDWLKILCAIAAAVVGLVLFFTMVGIRPARAQNFIVHFYGEYEYGDDYLSFEDVLEARLSYDVLQVRTEKFGGSMLDGASYTARRASGEGSVAIAADYAAEEGEVSPFRDLVQTGMSDAGGPLESLNMFYEVDDYFAGLETYLARFFGENWQSGEIDRAEAEKCFRARNVDGPNNKNRFRSDKEIGEGVESEIERLETLRADYNYLRAFGLGGEMLPYVQYASEIAGAEGETIETRTYAVGVGLGKLSRISSLVYYETADGAPAHDALAFLIYNNGAESYDDGTNDGRDDLKYEAVSCLRYLVEHYS